MWDRKSLKEKGKADFRLNRFVCILAAFLLMTVGAIGGGGGASGAFTGLASAGASSASNPYTYNSTEIGNHVFKGVATEDNQDVELDLDDIEGWEEEWADEYDDLYDDYDLYGDPYSSGLAGPDAFVLMAVLMILILVLLAVFLLLDIFIFNPVTVGLRKFFVANAKDHDAGLDRNTFGFAFYNGYKNIIGAMFVTKLFVFLLSLLLFVPGFIFGRYVWRMVPYILGENPDMKGSDARKLSSQMMDGHKWNTFVLDLSFIGWYLLAIVTLGISNLVWTAPYHAQTDAELYLALTGRNDASAYPQQDYNAPQQDTVIFEADETQTEQAVTEAVIPTEAVAETIETAAHEEAVSEVANQAPEDVYSSDHSAENVEDNYNY